MSRRNYAAETTVSVAKTRAEIEELLMRYGAGAFISGVDAEQNLAAIQFNMRGRRIKFVLPLPDIHAKEFAASPTGRVRYDADKRRAVWEQACRSRWRALMLCLKAKLEAIEIGVVTFEDEFLAHTVLPDGSRVGDHQERLLAGYSESDMPPLLGAPGA